MGKKFLPLIRILSSGKTRLHLVGREKFTVGRSPEADILLLANSISRKHLAVEIKDQAIYVEDLGSSNGSFLNEMKLESGKKYPLPPEACIRLGQSNELLTIELMEKPMEFDQYQTYLPKFNQELQGLVEQMSKEAHAKADAILKDAQAKADQFLLQAQSQAHSIVQKVKEQEDSTRELAESKASQHLKEVEGKASQHLKDAETWASQHMKDAETKAAQHLKEAESRASQLLKEAEAKSRADVEQVRLAIQKEVEELRTKTEQEVESFKSQRLEQIRVEAEKLYADSIAEAREKADREVDIQFEAARSRAREQITELKVSSQMQADQLLQDAHKEAARLKEAGLQDVEKLRADGLKKAQAILDEAEADSAKILSQAREASEKMRKSAQVDFDELQTRSQTQATELVQKAESEALQVVETARKRAQAIVDNQEKESALILSDLSARIQREAQKEAQRLLKETEDQVEAYKARAHQEVAEAQKQKSQVETLLTGLKQEVSDFDTKKKNLIEENQKIQTELARLKEENDKQAEFNAQLMALEKHIKALELQKIQMQEKNSETQREFELLKRNTFESLERSRKEEEKRILNLASAKASEFSQRIEKVIIGDINKSLNQKLNSSQLSEISRKVSDELINLFAAESFKVETKTVSPTAEVAPSFTQSPLFKWGAAAAAVVAIFVLVKASSGVVAQQKEYTNNLIEQQKEDLRFKPTLTNEYRGSYTDNILYMNRYLEIKNDPKVQDQWALNLNDFFISDLRLSEENMVRFIGIESAMLKRLATLRESVDSRYFEEGINRMREVEKEEVAKIMQLLQTPANYNRLRTREKIFLAQMAQSVPVPNAARQDAPNPATPSAPAQAQKATEPTPVPTPTAAAPTTPTLDDEDESMASTGHRKPATHKEKRSKKRDYPYRN